MTVKERPFGMESTAYYGVFDGHAGFQAAHFCREILGKKLDSYTLSHNDVADNLKRGKWHRLL